MATVAQPFLPAAGGAVLQMKIPYSPPKSFRIRFYAKLPAKPFRIRIYEKCRGVGAYCSAFSISVTGMAPSRRTFQSSPRNSMIVDGNAAPVSPPSRTSGNRVPSCFIT